MIHNRIDAEYFNPEFDQIIKKIKNTKEGWNELTNIVNVVRPNFNPKNNPKLNFEYVELSDIETITHTIQSSSSLLGRNIPSRGKQKLKKGDVIVSSVEGSADKVALVSAKNDSNIASNGFFQFRTKSIKPEMLLVMFTTTILQSQLKRESTGTILMAVPKKALTKFIVPKIDKKTECDVVSLVQQSHTFKKKATELLSKCTNDVELLINS